jgi:hypothetical protein
MRILVFVLSVVVASALEVGAITLIVLTAPSHAHGLIGLPSGAVGLIVYGSILLGSLRAYWDVGSSSGGRKLFRRWLIVVGSAEAAGVVITVVYVVMVSAPWWLPVALLVGAVLLTVAATAVGRALFAQEQVHRPIDPSWNPITAPVIARKRRAIAITFVAALVLGLALFVIFGRGSVHSLPLLTAVAEFAFFAAAIAGIVVTIPLSRQLRDALGRDLGMVRTVSKVVIRKKSIELSEAEQVAAVKYAVIVPTSLSFTLASLALLYTGVAIQQIGQLRYGDPISVLLLVLLVVILLVAFPLQIVQIRRARRYARDHADKLPSQSTDLPA